MRSQPRSQRTHRYRPGSQAPLTLQFSQTPLTGPKPIYKCRSQTSHMYRSQNSRRPVPRSQVPLTESLTLNSHMNLRKTHSNYPRACEALQLLSLRVEDNVPIDAHDVMLDNLKTASMYPSLIPQMPSSSIFSRSSSSSGPTPR